MHTLFTRYVAAFVALIALAAFGCAPKTPSGPSLREVPRETAAVLAANLSPAPQHLDSWTGYAPALAKSLKFAAAKPAGEPAVRLPGLELTWGGMAASLSELLDLLPRLDAAPELLAERFALFELNPGTLITGYYEPWLEASLKRSPEYPVPILGVPDDMLTADLGAFHPRWKGEKLTYRLQGGKIAPYFSRAEIEAGALSGKGLEIAWARDPVDVYFLQVQGSGRLALPGGGVKHVLFAGKNGHEYRGVGKSLIERGELTREEMSMQAIRAWFAENPGRVREVMHTDPSYVFFRLGDEGPFGSMNAALTPWVSVATDRSVIPNGMPLVVAADLPGAGGEEPRRLRGLATSQDTGGAIKGTRVDFFCGSGPEAVELAGHLKSRASVWLLVSRAVLGK